MADITALPLQLRDRWRAVVLGNSGSLLDIPPQQEWKGQPLVIGVNRMLRQGLDGRQYVPDILVVSDIRAFESDRQLIEDAPECVHVCVPWWVASECRPLQSRPWYVFEATTEGTGRGISQYKRQDILQSLEFPKTLVDPLVSICNVSFHALQLAYLLRPKHIMIAGVECAWPPGSGLYADKPHHFYDVDEIRNVSQRPFPLSNGFHSMWFRIRNYLLPQVPVFDISPWQRISQLPFPPLNAIALLNDEQYDRLKP